jgi:hypothetical protein
MSMLSRNHKGIIFNPDDIGQWCGECIELIGCYEALELITNEPVKITNGLGAAPCNAYRILKLNINGNCVPVYKIEAPYIKIPKYNGNATIDYLRIPLDEEGYPKIDAAARQGCYYYCLAKIKYDDYLNGKLTVNAWADINNNMDKAKGTMRNVTIDDTNHLSAVMFNVTKGVISPPTYK